MTLKDLVVLAGGFELSAYTNEVEISRLIIENNKSTEVKVATVSVNPDLSINGEGANYVLQPFDKVYVRAVSEFENQTTVRLIGQVKYPGNYVLLDKNEKLSSVIKRAGGLTKEAFQEGARLNREYNDVGLVVMNLDQAMKFDNSRFNYILKPNDEIIIPKQEDIVTIQSSLIKRSRNATDVDESLNVDLNMLSVAHLPNKRADYYIGKYAGGFDEKADRKNLYVNHPNGELAETRNYGLFRLYPKVRKGSVIIIPDLPLETEEDKKNQDVDWNQLLSDSVSQAMTIVTLLLLIERI
jgi:protein involved in polysaccharide export with SLBB domain